MKKASSSDAVSLGETGGGAGLVSGATGVGADADELAGAGAGLAGAVLCTSRKGTPKSLEMNFATASSSAEEVDTEGWGLGTCVVGGTEVTAFFGASEGAPKRLVMKSVMASSSDWGLA